MPTFPNKARMGDVRKILNDTGLMAVNNDAGRAPTNSDDRTAGYEVGSRWFFADRVWTCTNSDEGAAIWEDANSLALSADAKAAEAQQVQARRDIGKFYLTDYLDYSDMLFALEGNTAAQDEARVTAAVRAMWDDFIDWVSASPGKSTKLVMAPLTLAINDEPMSEHFAQKLWDMGFSFDSSRVEIDFSGVQFVLKNWSAAASVRTSGFWAAHGITDPVPKAVFRWEQSSPRQFSPQIRGRLHIIGSRQITDPIGFKAISWNTANLDRIAVRGLANWGVFIENLFNSSVLQMEVSNCGYQPTDFGGTGFLPQSVRFSNVGAVVGATEPVFDSSHVGGWFGLAEAGPQRGGNRQVHWATITSVDSPTQITLASVPDADVSDATATFEAIRGSINAGDNVLTLTTPITDSLVGRYITIGRCGIQGVAGGFGSMTPRVVGHIGDQVTLSHRARLSVTDAPVIIAAGKFLYRSADGHDAGLAVNDDVTYDNLRIENGTPSSAVCAVIGAATNVDFSPGSKFHGTSTAGNNFGANFADILYDYAADVRLNSCIVAHGGHSPRFGRQMIGGGFINVEFTGSEADFISGTESASIYNDMQAGPTTARFYFGPVRHNSLVGNQVVVRLGASGELSQIRSANSAREARVGGGKEVPTYLDDLVLSGSVSGAAFSRDGAPGQPATFAAGTIMLPGYGGDTGAILPPLVTNLDTIVQAHRRVRFNAAATGAPWAAQAGHVDVSYNGDNVIQRAWCNTYNGRLRAAYRHNNNTALRTWSAWTPIQTGNSGTTAQRPTDPLLAEQYFDTTLALPILWNGTAWIDFTGTAV